MVNKLLFCKFLTLNLLSFAFLFGGAFSASASTIGAVGSPKVKEGALELNIRSGYSEADKASSDDNRFRSRVHLDYGVTHFYAARIIASQDRRKGNNLEHDALKFENRFYLLKAQDYGLDFGVRAGYTLKDGDKKPDSVDFGFYELVPFERYELRANQIFSHDVGSESDDGVSAELRFQALKKFEGYNLGVESFHSLGNLSDNESYSEQSHTIGPVLKANFFDLGEIETGYRAGISESAPDHSFKVFFSRKF